MAIAPESTGIGLVRHFTRPDVHPYDTVVWERRDARITNWKDGTVAFEQLGVEVPSTWSVNATNILAQKYFRGPLGTPERESSLRQVVDRVADTITTWGMKDGYFLDAEEAEAFRDELKYLVIHQKAAFNSPVWFNIGVAGVPQQASACFILAVDDSMDSILNWYREEGTIFKGGSGAGVNLSKIRSSIELLNGGGTASGPVSFMRGADSSAGTIKSGGKTRRAAKMVILDADHPDIEDFIWCKAREERKARVLRDAGFDMDLDGRDSISIQYQNANNSVRVSDEFMQAVVDDADWHLKAVTDGSTVRVVKARDLYRQIMQAAWECADPGMQFDSTINRWHTAHEDGRINGSNPCFTADTLVHTDKGLIRFDELFGRANAGESFQVYTHDITNPDAPAQDMVLTSPEAFMITGRNPIVRLRFSSGLEVRCTPGHRIFTTNRGYVEAQHITPDDRVRSLDLPTPAVNADWAIPQVAREAAARLPGERFGELVVPDAWDTDFGHYLGWLIGDGATSNGTTCTIYGSAEDRDEIMPAHADVLEAFGDGRPLKVSEQANGTAQLRLSRRSFKRFVEALGVGSVTGEHKRVPWSIQQAPPEIASAFLRGLFDADGTVVHNDAKGSYVGLGSISRSLLVDVQRLLSTFGVTSRIYATGTQGTHAWPTGTYAKHAAYQLRITSGSVERYAAEVGFDLSRKAALLAEVIASRRPYEVDTTVRLVDRTDEGVELTYNLSEPRNHSYVANGVVVRNCSEYMHVDNSACNLASLNLLTFLNDDGTFDVTGYRRAIEVVFTAQEILVGNSDYPTEPIGQNARKFRQLGLGYANVGALLMAQGLPYDSDGGRAWAGALTALLTGHAYATSARTAARMGPFAGYTKNREHMLRVLTMHRDEVAKIDEELVPTDLLSAAQEAWEEAVELGETYGVRNAQASVLAPTGTIGLLMDCDTTGIEPDLSLVKTKKLVGGGTMSIVNQTIPRALRRLGYDEAKVEDIVAYIDEHKSIVGAPYLAAEHLPVFACSMGDNTIHYLGHVRMMAAAQPFISGAISKTVNLPEDATVEDVERLHLDAWEMGIKAIAIYRDNCKVGQPLSTTKSAAASADSSADHASVSSASDATPPSELTAKIAELESALERQVVVVKQPQRERLPRRRRSNTFKFRVADCEGYVTVSEYDDGRPGEVFIKVSKQGSTLAGVMDAFSISISLGLQHGVPLSTYVSKYTNMKFEPAGMTDDPELRLATSLVDYIFRRMAVDYMDRAEREEIGLLTTGERLQPTLPGVEEAVTPDESSHDPEVANSVPPHTLHRQPQLDAPLCMQCGTTMQRAGSCYVCTGCGSTSGCS